MSYRRLSLSLGLALVLGTGACGESKPSTSGGGTGGTGTGGGSPAGTGGASPSAGTGGTMSPGSGGVSPGSGGSGGGGAPGTGGGSAPSDTAPPSDSAAPNEAGPPAAGIDQRCREMVTAAEAFLKSLDGDGNKRAQAALQFGQRRHFKYDPGDRPGLTLGAMTEAQRITAFALVKTGLSGEGFEKAETVRKLEFVLRAGGGDPAFRDPLKYHLAVFGTPSVDGDWAWHWEGHHISLHYSLSKCTLIADTPSFFGANPARVGASPPAEGPPAGTRALAKEEDLARALAMALSADAQKRAMAITNSTFMDVDNNPRLQMPRTPAGLAASAMSAAEAEQLKGIIMAYAAAMPSELAAERLKKVQDAGFDKVSFIWGGSLAMGQVHSYRIQGPTFLIEYINVMNNGNHIHAVWRDFNGDFGVDVIKLHMEQVPH